MIHYCTWCEDEYTPVEYATPSFDPDTEEFCSDTCEDSYWEGVDAEESYNN